MLGPPSRRNGHRKSGNGLRRPGQKRAAEDGAKESASAPPPKRSKKGKKKARAGDLSVEEYVRVVPVPRRSELLQEGWQPVMLSKIDKAAQAQLSADRRTVTSSKGYRMVRALLHVAVRHSGLVLGRNHVVARPRACGMPTSCRRTARHLDGSLQSTVCMWVVDMEMLSSKQTTANCATLSLSTWIRALSGSLMQHALSVSMSVHLPHCCTSMQSRLLYPQPSPE